MQKNHSPKRAFSRRQVLGGTVFTLLPFIVGTKVIAADALASQFNFLSKNGNSNCTKAFLDSIPTMPKDARLQGSCCSPMELTRYVKQVKELTKYKANSDIPPNPYDIEAGLAKLLIHDYHFDGKQVTEVWNISNGCGGT